MVKEISKILDDLVKKGSSKSDILKLKKPICNLLKKDMSYSDTIECIGNSIKDHTASFLDDKNEFDTKYIEGISTNIYVGDTRGNTSIKVLSGTTKRDGMGLKIDDNTLFDVASITKLYTLLFAFTVENLGLDLNTRVVDLNKDFNLGDFTINDLIRLCGEIQTDGLVKNASSVDEAYKILKTAHLKSDDRTTNKYNDLGPLIISIVLTDWLNKKYNLNKTYEGWLNTLIFKHLNIKDTLFNPTSSNISGNGCNIGVHDPMAKALGGVAGHAGIFTNSNDLEKLAQEIFDINIYGIGKLLITKEQIKRIGEITFPNSIQSNKGNMGVYVKRVSKTFTSMLYSDGSFSSQGWTGSVATFDPSNQIHQSILVNAIKENDLNVKNDKPLGFMDRFISYQSLLTDDTMMLFIASKYYHHYVSSNEVINRVLTYKI